jgi:hypothetical protein
MAGKKQKNYCQPKGSKGGFRKMNATGKFANIAPILLLAGALMAPGCAGGPLTTREKGASIGVLGGIGESKP